MSIPKLFLLLATFSMMAPICALKCYRKNRDENDTDARVEECPEGTKGCLAALGCAIPCMSLIDVRACTPYEDACDDENKMNVSDKVVCYECSVCHTDLCNGQGLFKLDTTAKPDSKEESTKSAKPALQCYVKGNVTECPADAKGCQHITDCSISVIWEQQGCAMVEDPCNAKVSGDVTPNDFSLKCYGEGTMKGQNSGKLDSVFQLGILFFPESWILFFSWEFCSFRKVGFCFSAGNSVLSGKLDSVFQLGILFFPESWFLFFSWEFCSFRKVGFCFSAGNSVLSGKLVSVFQLGILFFPESWFLFFSWEFCSFRKVGFCFSAGNSVLSVKLVSVIRESGMTCWPMATPSLTSTTQFLLLLFCGKLAKLACPCCCGECEAFVTVGPIKITAKK